MKVFARLLIAVLSLYAVRLETRADIPVHATLLSTAHETVSAHSIPIQEEGADPWVVEHKGVIYYTQTSGDRIQIWSARDLAEIKAKAPVTVWSASQAERSASKNIWAPELHQFNGRWYIYYAADDGSNENHRMYVLESESGPLGPYKSKGKLAPKSQDFWAIDGTPFRKNGELYFVWSGWHDTNEGKQNLYISKMKNPWTLDDQRHLISSPELHWESTINEGPQILENNGTTYLVYSAEKSWTDNYKLGMLTLSDANPLKRESWLKSTQPVFDSVTTGTDEIYAPGHCSFLKDERTGVHWILYHVAKARGAGWNREVRAQLWNWRADGAPNFGQPLPRL